MRALTGPHNSNTSFHDRLECTMWPIRDSVVGNELFLLGRLFKNNLIKTGQDSLLHRQGAASSNPGAGAGDNRGNDQGRR